MIAPMLSSLRPVRWGIRRAKKFSRSRRFRQATSRLRILPAYLIIGAQRAGTTSLYDFLCRHPDVAGPTAAKTDIHWAKELHFFDDKYWLGVDWYRSFFPLAVTRAVIRRRGGDLLAGEASPSYLFHPAVPERVATTVPDVRLIALLRDPIERAYSHYQLMVRTGREELSFEDALAAEDERLAAEEERMRADPRHSSANYRHYAYLTRGLYADQLERWLAYFPREQLLVVRAEDFRARPGEIYAEIIAFLGLRPWQPAEFPPRNRASYAPIDPALRARLEERFAEPNARLARLLDRDFAWGSAAPAAEDVEIASARGPQPA
jgi:lipopolysaccharide transport system ATP-binding protein